MPEINSSFFKSLFEKFGSKVVLDTDSLPDYARDASEIRVSPPAIFFAENESDVIEAINLCREGRVPIVLRGAGTGYTGGCVPVPDGLVLSLQHLKKLEIDPVRKLAYCGPGVITLDLMRAAEEKGLFYPPDPASYDESTLGGNVAECAGGLHCKKYGVTKDYVIGLKGVTIGGEILMTGVYAESELFNLEGILVGSEGMLAAITEIALRLIDVPQTGPTILAAFPEPEDAAKAVAEITRRGLVPAVMEYMDGDAVACSMEYERAVEIARAAAILLFETSGHRAATEAEEIEAVCRTNKSSLLKLEYDREEAEKLWKIRRNLSKAVKASAREKISEDVAVPPSKLPELVNFVAQMAHEYPLRINSYGHAGDGNLHVNFLVRQEDKDVHAYIDEGIGRLFRKTLELGGTLTGEHGIGLTKKKFMPLEFDPPTLRWMKEIKSIFDPENLLNPGKMFV
ncbi:Glycolate oxidase, subunit GlcD [Candidatus Zixiibacteriota bacterium]|nr:Glycolate oxidase, subunit GlcD [candidate division Zixibacteria bacterium]